MPKSKFIKVLRKEVHYTDEGQGPPILLLHGVGQSLHSWYDWLPVLEDSHRVISVTLPGSGLTGPILGADYGDQFYVRFIKAFLLKLGIEQTSVIGHSLGGMIAWSYAATYPEDVGALVLISPAGGDNSSRLPAALLAEAPYFDNLLKYVTPRIFVKLHLLLSYLPQTQLVTDSVVTRYYELNHVRGNRDALLQIFKGINRTNLNTLKQVQAPTLIMWGKEDRVFPVSYAQKFRENIPGAKLILYQKIGHSIVESIPKDASLDSLKFIEENQ